jgi:hypothetical protein
MTRPITSDRDSPLASPTQQLELTKLIAESRSMTPTEIMECLEDYLNHIGKLDRNGNSGTSDYFICLRYCDYLINQLTPKEETLKLLAHSLMRVSQNVRDHQLDPTNYSISVVEWFVVHTDNVVDDVLIEIIEKIIYTNRFCLDSLVKVYPRTLHYLDRDMVTSIIDQAGTFNGSQLIRSIVSVLRTGTCRQTMSSSQPFALQATGTCRRSESSSQPFALSATGPDQNQDTIVNNDLNQLDADVVFLMRYLDNPALNFVVSVLADCNCPEYYPLDMLLKEYRNYIKKYANRISMTIILSIWSDLKMNQCQNKIMKWKYYEELMKQKND